jgi:hypothetical protein
MAVSDVSPAHQDPVGSALKGPQYVVRRYGRRTHDSNRPDIVRVSQPAYTCQIGRSICTPVTHKSDYLWFKTCLFHHFSPRSGNLPTNSVQARLNDMRLRVKVLRKGFFLYLSRILFQQAPFVAQSFGMNVELSYGNLTDYAVKALLIWA